MKLKSLRNALLISLFLITPASLQAGTCDKREETGETEDILMNTHKSGYVKSMNRERLMPGIGSAATIAERKFLPL